MVSGGDCFVAGLSFSSPRALLLVLEEGANLTDPLGASAFSASNPPQLDYSGALRGSLRSRALLSSLQCSQARVRWPFCPLPSMAWHTTAHR